ncbi:MAG: gluconokinase [Steroidobacteraceae bacterium]
MPVVVMGVSASGKTTVGQALAHALHLPFLEGDALHPPDNIAKMSRGDPLDDADRAPWLAAIAASLADRSRYPRGLVVACSALKAGYREELRQAAPGLTFVFLDATAALVEARLASRQHHFMPPGLQGSQFATLEPPTRAEADVVTLDAAKPVEALAAAAVASIGKLRKLSPSTGL